MRPIRPLINWELICFCFPKSRDHLFFQSEFAAICWNYVCLNWNSLPACIEDQLANLKTMMVLSFSMDIHIIILIAWSIWNTINDRGIAPNLYARTKKLKEELQWLVHGAKRKAYAALPDWVQAFKEVGVLHTLLVPVAVPLYSLFLV